jgi:hypothetical protein
MKKYVSFMAAMVLATMAAPVLVFGETVLQTSPPDNGSLVADLSQQVYFTNWSGSYLSTVVQKTLLKMAPLNFDLGYTSADLSASGFNGIRLVESVVNKTGTTWTDYHVSFDPSVGIWQQNSPGYIPDTYLVQYDSVNNRWVATDAPSLATVTVGTSQVDFVFNSGQQILDGQSFGFYIAFNPTTSDGTVHVGEYPTPLPQTSSIPLPSAAWSGIALLGSLLGKKTLKRLRRQEA